MAYTKYSLTPANNNATPPDGAPEGMLPSAVNDTMRDMMAQIRDVGDGIRNGTYTMTAPVITGGSITGVALSGNTFTNPVITGGSINNTPIGASTANTGAFTTLSASGATTFSGATVVSGSLTANTFSSSGATITGGSINSTAIGGTTAAAGKFTTLEATGVTTVQAGTVSAPAITTSGDTNTGIFFPAADTIAFTEGGVESMRIDSSGQVGIGVTSPITGGARLSVRASGDYDAGLVIGSNSSAANWARLDFKNTNHANAAILYQEQSGIFGIRTSGATPILLETNSAERMRIDSSGNVGIGTSSPSLPLQITAGNKSGFNISYDNGGALRTGLFMWTAGGSDGSIGGGVEQTSDNVFTARSTLASFIRFNNGETRFFNNASLTSGNTYTPTERMRIDSNGNLLVGTTTASARLTVNGSVYAQNFGNGGTAFQLNDNTGTAVNQFIDVSLAKAGGAYNYIKFAFNNIDILSWGGPLSSYADILTLNSPQSAIVFKSANSERMRITSGGYFKASNTGTYQNSTGAFHEFYSNGQTTEVLFIKSDNASYTGDAVFVDVNRNTTNNSFYAINYYNRVANAYRFRVADSGNVTNTNGSYGTISDIKNKENIVDATPKLDKIKQLQVRNFNFKGDDLKQIGFIAQEFEQVFPSMVEEHHDKDADGNDLGTTTKSIKTSVLVPILVKSIQEQQAMIEELKQEVALLKSK